MYPKTRARIIRQWEKIYGDSATPSPKAKPRRVSLLSPPNLDVASANHRTWSTPKRKRRDGSPMMPIMSPDEPALRAHITPPPQKRRQPPSTPSGTSGKKRIHWNSKLEQVEYVEFYDRTPILPLAVQCDGCSWVLPLGAPSLHCTICPDFDLCIECIEVVPHDQTHEFRVVQGGEIDEDEEEYQENEKATALPQNTGEVQQNEEDNNSSGSSSSSSDSDDEQPAKKIRRM